MWFDETVAASGPTLTVAQTCASSDLRRRWRSWIVLGLLAGLTVGLACAGFAGARRTSGVVSNYAIASDAPDAAILANDPDYDEDVRAAVAQLPEVERTAPFMVPFLMEVTSPAGMDIPLLPLDADRPLGWDPIVEGRLPDPARPDEIVINEALRDQFDLAIGDTVTVEQPAVDIHDDELPFPVPDGAAEATDGDAAGRRHLQRRRRRTGLGAVSGVLRPLPDTARRSDQRDGPPARRSGRPPGVPRRRRGDRAVTP